MWREGDSDFSAQDQGNDVISISETSWPGKHAKNAGWRGLGYSRLPWFLAKSNRTGQGKQAALCFKGVHTYSEAQDRGVLFTPLLHWTMSRASSRVWPLKAQNLESDRQEFRSWLYRSLAVWFWQSDFTSLCLIVFLCRLIRAPNWYGDRRIKKDVFWKVLNLHVLFFIMKSILR